MTAFILFYDWPTTFSKTSRIFEHVFKSKGEISVEANTVHNYTS